jgi:hypothetical protein
MATVKICDFCKHSPNDLEAPSGGDVRRAFLRISGHDNGNVGCPTETREFDACAHCRQRLFGEVLENIAAGIPATTETELEMLKRLADEQYKRMPAIPIPAYPWDPWIPPRPEPVPAYPPRIIYKTTTGDNTLPEGPAWQ